MSAILIFPSPRTAETESLFLLKRVIKKAHRPKTKRKAITLIQRESVLTVALAKTQNEPSQAINEKDFSMERENQNDQLSHRIDDFSNFESKLVVDNYDFTVSN